jgi:hypothetical protein
VEAGILWSVRIRSKSQQSRCFPLLKGLDYTVDTAAFEVTFRRETGQVSFTKSGLVRVNGRLAEHIVELVEKSLT